jgi:NADH-quinone oxidoreductase subunit J
MVLFVCVIMLLTVRAEEAKADRQKYLKLLAGPLFLALLAEVFLAVRYIDDPPPGLPSGVDAAQIPGTVESLGQAMFSSYVLPFEAVSVLILMAMVGAMLLARRESEEKPAVGGPKQ